jgi:hypothetical protein
MDYQHSTSKKLILESQQVTIWDLRTALELSIRIVHNTDHEELGYCKVCA